MRKKALWATTSARGGIYTFVEKMRETSLWSEWDILVISTHAEGPIAKRVYVFLRATIYFLIQVIFARPSIVHLHVSHYGSFARKALLMWSAKLFGLPVVFHIHGSRFQEFAKGAPPLYRTVIRASLEHADAVLALGDIWAERLRSYAPKARVIVMPNAVRPEVPVQHRAGESVNVVFLGEIGDRKGAFTLIRAWSDLMADDSRHYLASLTMAGNGEVDRAVRLSKELGLEASVNVRGWISTSEVRELLYDSHVLVLPSMNEGQPMAILEAMAMGLCVIASEVGGIPELLARGGGLLIRPGNREELVRALVAVIDDYELRAHYGHAALERVREEFNVDVLSRRIEALYSEILKNH